MSRYTTSEDGHIIGHDGFVIPKDFAEFYERFPRHVRGFVYRNWTHSSTTDRRDREHDLLMHLMSLPPDSMYREPGYNGHANGCQDRIQVFHPDLAYTVSAKSFLKYINMCLKRYYSNCRRDDPSNPVCQASAISIGSLDPSGEVIGEEYVLALASSDFRTNRHCDINNHRIIEERVRVNEFLDYVRKHNPKMLTVLDAIFRSSVFMDAQRELGTKSIEFERGKLARLFKRFQSGQVPYRQRKSRKGNSQFTAMEASK